MNIATTADIMDETDARLRAATDADEVRRIGIDHVRALGADLATTAYLKVVNELQYTDDERLIFLQGTVGQMLQSLEQTFVKNDVQDTDLLRDHLEAALLGFTDRITQLFSVVSAGGSA